MSDIWNRTIGEPLRCGDREIDSLADIKWLIGEVERERALADRLAEALRLLRTEGDRRAYDADVALAAYDEARRG